MSVSILQGIESRDALDRQQRFRQPFVPCKQSLQAFFLSQNRRLQNRLAAAAQKQGYRRDHASISEGRSAASGNTFHFYSPTSLPHHEHETQLRPSGCK